MHTKLQALLRAHQAGNSPRASQAFWVTAGSVAGVTCILHVQGY